ncbi:bifunctional riboflavin kinase/FAD synthetase [Helicobacter sp. 13S00477-4]|uniref:bifunctional riboflavin kinase/FAD synthetase n=1 Tax=Helicobacter sp. 13S00477-4 TaxID=1905759 RepID=UPI000BA63EE2|nr:bifunctional riboflavin kinase/FAD synthetase [Helicobacter sp. 13S00477-4]PAF52765.1 riboflavin biosynthesis protein RibF [Helicobacter sp. 13S00477-4]
MKNFLSMPKNSKITAIAMGKFDGVHLAHHKLFEFLDSNGCVLLIDKDRTPCITPFKFREKLIPFRTYWVPFKEVYLWEGKDFIVFLCEKLPQLQKIIVGYDFRFGRDKNYGADDLKNLFKGEVVIVPEVKIDSIPLHSSIIRELIAFGDLALANRLLGRNYFLEGRVVSGQNLGSRELYPTINIKHRLFVLPANGVYAAFTHIKSKIFPSVCFVGNRLSTDRSFAIETHILDREIILDEKNIRIEFVAKIRDNRHFEKLSELKKQITRDIKVAKKILKY